MDRNYYRSMTTEALVRLVREDSKATEREIALADELEDLPALTDKLEEERADALAQAEASEAKVEQLQERVGELKEQVKSLIGELNEACARAAPGL